MIATIEFVKECFDRFNAEMFAGELPAIPIVLSRAKTFLGKVEYKSIRGFFGRIWSNSDFRMKISTAYDLPEEELEDVVLHEMIHYYIAVKKIRDKSAHGPRFREMMKSINAGYGRHITISHRLK